MNLTIEEGLELVKQVLDGSSSDCSEIIFFPPSIALSAISGELKNTEYKVGIQNIHHEKSGAYTGEISTKMARDIGAYWALVGHSERRQLQKESDELVKQKLECSLKAGMNVIVCVGETLEERLSGQAESVVSKQLKKVLAIDLTKIQTEVVIAYEPIWAIGSGESATLEEVQEMHAFIRNVLLGVLGTLGANVRILYGGSVTAENSADLIKQDHVDGLLVGGASLKADSFSSILNALD